MLSNGNKHMQYWLQITLRRQCMWLNDGVRAQVLTQHFRNIAETIKEETLKMTEISRDLARSLSTKEVYKEMKRDYVKPRAQLRMKIHDGTKTIDGTVP